VPPDLGGITSLASLTGVVPALPAGGGAAAASALDGDGYSTALAAMLGPRAGVPLVHGGDSRSDGDMLAFLRSSFGGGTGAAPPPVSRSAGRRGRDAAAMQHARPEASFMQGFLPQPSSLRAATPPSAGPAAAPPGAVMGASACTVRARRASSVL